MVQINEVIVGVGIALGMQSLNDCPSFDVNGNNQVTIEEIIQAVDAALNGCTSSASGQLTNAASGVAVSTSSTVSQVVTILDFGSVGFGGAGAASAPLAGRALQLARQLARSSRSMSSTIDNGGGGQIFDFCPFGGTVENSCTFDPSSGEYTLDTFFSECDYFDQFGNEIFIDGSIRQSSANALICAGVSVGSIDAFYELFDLVVDVTDPTGTTTETFAGDLADLVSPVGEGCAGPGSVQALDGDVELTVFSPDGGVVYDVSYFSDNLGLGVASSGSPCATILLTDGTLEAFNELTLEDYVQDYISFAIVSIFRDDGSVDRTLEGGINSRCVGNIEIATPQALRFRSEDDLCPIGGTLQVTLSNQSVTHVGYSPAGVDLNGDGRADVSTCIDPSIAQCPGECNACTSDADCVGALECFSCSDNCTRNPPDRCAPVDFSAMCSDGSF